MGDLFPIDRCVSHEKYEDAKSALKAYKNKDLKQFARNDEKRALKAWWPFD